MSFTQLSSCSIHFSLGNHAGEILKFSCVPLRTHTFIFILFGGLVFAHWRKRPHIKFSHIFHMWLHSYILLASEQGTTVRARHLQWETQSSPDRNPLRWGKCSSFGCIIITQKKKKNHQIGQLEFNISVSRTFCIFERQQLGVQYILKRHNLLMPLCHSTHDWSHW